MKDGAIGKQFTKDGAIGGTGQAVAEKASHEAKKVPSFSTNFSLPLMTDRSTSRRRRRPVAYDRPSEIHAYIIKCSSRVPRHKQISEETAGEEQCLWACILSNLVLDHARRGHGCLDG